MTPEEKICPWCGGDGSVAFDDEGPFNRAGLVAMVEKVIMEMGNGVVDAEDPRGEAKRLVAKFVDKKEGE